MVKKSDEMNDILNAVDALNKKYGKGSIFVGQQKIRIPTYRTGILALDHATHTGGFPRGRLIEIYGKESSGKTYITFKNIAECQSRGETCVFLDVEQAFDPIWASKCGVDVSKLIFGQPSTAEEVFDTIEMFARTGKVSLIVIDSVAAMTTQKEEESESIDIGFPQKAKLLSNGMRRVVPILAQTKTNAIFINHLMEDIGKMGFGPKTTTPGGKALKYYSSLRIECAKIKTLKDGDFACGCRTKVKIIKNKLATPYGEGEYDFIFGSGVSNEVSYIEFAEQFGVIKKEGRKYVYGKDSFSTSVPDIIEYLKTENGMKLMSEVNEKIYNHNGEIEDENETEHEQISSGDLESVGTQNYSE